MIWRAVRHIFVTEILAWIVFLLFAVFVSSLGLHLSGSNTVSAILLLLWFGLFLFIYRARYKHL